MQKNIYKLGFFLIPLLVLGLEASQTKASKAETTPYIQTTNQQPRLNNQKTASFPLYWQVKEVKYDRPIIVISIKHSPEVAYIKIKNKDTEIQKIDTSDSKENEISLSLELENSELSALTAEAYSQDDKLIFITPSLTINPKVYAPNRIAVELPQNQVVNQSVEALKVTTFTPNTVESNLDSLVEIPISLDVLLDGKVIETHVINSGKVSTIPGFRVALGKHQIQFVARNAWGEYHSDNFQVINFGVALPSETFILIDKTNFSLYFIKNKAIKSIYPIAIGRPKTPTIAGDWIIGKNQRMPNPNTGWGVLRLLLYRKNAYARKHWSGYAIHGTNRPRSIGTEASHGCIRMFNQDVLKLASELQMGTPVLIKHKLEVYIDEIGTTAKK